jgi:uncharacterized protein DUF2188
VDTSKKRFANAHHGYTESVRHLEEEPEMAEGFVHTVHVDGHWENTIEGQEGMVGGGPYRTKSEALAGGRAEAKRRQTEPVIHNEDGSIGERNSYGGDPAHRPG